jgi:glucose/arabinose dehydrogenase
MFTLTFVFAIANDLRYEDLHIGAAGKHFGWPMCEGPCDNNPGYSTCSCAVHDDPIFTYPHNERGACIVGGFVYRGSQFPAE